jgi:hypothetical protein
MANARHIAFDRDRRRLLLGRHPSHVVLNRDPRIITAEEVLPALRRLRADADDLDQALAVLLGSHSVAPATKSWAQVLQQHIRALEGRAPAPEPAPTPTPTGLVSWASDLSNVVDQGENGWCVGFGTGGRLSAKPQPADTAHHDYCRDFYLRCTVLDGNPETATTPPDQQHGSTVHTAAKVARERGFLSSYVWITTPQGVIDWVTTQGPVLWGTDWTDQMFSPDASGVVQVAGRFVGGHCYWSYGYDPDTDLLWQRNSWSTAWGVAGPGDAVAAAGGGGDFAFKASEAVPKLLAGSFSGYPGEALGFTELPVVVS